MRMFAKIAFQLALLFVCIQPAKAQVAVEYVHTDQLGTPVAFTDANRIVIERREHLPFGEALLTPLHPGPDFTGHVLDRDTALVYMQQRYFDPEVGQFLSTDPISTDATTGRNFNRYWYADNNPYTKLDPDGRQSREFNFENRRLGVAPPPRAQGDWLGPVIGGSLAFVSLPALVYGGAELGLAALANPVTANNIGIGIAELGAGTTIGVKTVVTAAKVEAALADSTMRTTQTAVSLPAVQRYVGMLEEGSPAPAIKVDGNVIVEGNHRYIAGRILGTEPAVQPGTVSPSDVSRIKPIQELKVDPTDWGNR